MRASYTPAHYFPVGDTAYLARSDPSKKSHAVLTSCSSTARHSKKHSTLATMQNWGKFSLFAIRVMSEVQIVLLQDAWCTAHNTRVRARVLNLACGAMVRK
jgi:hypothetical protein